MSRSFGLPAHQPFAGERPVPIRVLRHDRLGISYLQAGQIGPALFFLHGWGAFKELWWHTLRSLGRNYRCYAPDIPGHGESTMAGDGSIVTLGDQMARFCEDLGLRQMVLFGHSMGASVAVELALRHTDLVQRLVLVDPAVDAYRMPAYSRTYLLPHVGWPALRLTQAFGRHVGRLGRHVPHEHGGGWIRPWLRRISYHALFDPEGLHRILHSLFATRAGDRLAAIRVPTLVVSGALDGLVPASLSRQVALQMPNARFVQIPAALHNPMDERPQAFVRIVRPFLEDVE
jgi:3-oxoadipate enol-lactonase